MQKLEIVMKSVMTRSGVVYLKGKPGIGKTAVIELLAKKHNLRYMDLRLSMMAEEDFMIPSIQNGIIVSAIPEWAVEANKQPTLVVFEELNRASLGVRNASLQILLEKRIGVNFKFNNTVYFMATGNLGDEDGTEVEDFDSALNNRLIHVNFSMSVKEWYDDYAKEHVHPIVSNFLINRPEHFYKTSEGSAYATPRSWTFFSDLIIHEMKFESNIQEIKKIANMIGESYVGKSILPFINYIETVEQISINDILDNFSKVKNTLLLMNRDVLNLLLNSLKSMKINDLSSKQFKNVCSYLKCLSEDEQVSYLIHVLETEEIEEPETNSYNLLFVIFKTLSKKIKGICS